MKNEIGEYFDMPALLKHVELDTRRFADSSELSAAKYFLMLSKFIHLAPDVSTAIHMFIMREADIDTCKSLDDMAALLKEMGCKKFVPEIYSILDAYKKGNLRLAAFHADAIKDSFESFYSQIMKAKSAAKPTSDPGAKTYTQDAGLSLKEFIHRLDGENNNRKPVILAVDDSKIILQSVSSVLSDAYKVFVLPKPMELEKVLQTLTPDLFLLDYLMPEINGFELVPIIRKLDAHKDTPIIFLTSEGKIDTLTTAMGLGACDFIVKPFAPDTLREKIARHIVKKKVH
ncbi:MAG: response regulator [Oscillospiraceae bacterium]|jgi:PleD family two-component response regulator|nr:response regulator [Oscillospiraceae bacterium]